VQKQESIPEARNVVEGFMKRWVLGNPDTTKTIPNNENIMTKRKNQEIILSNILKAKPLVSVKSCAPLLLSAYW
jgi:hypothetical protein